MDDSAKDFIVMAIDTNQPVRTAVRQTKSGTLTIRVGMEAGVVVVEEDGVIRRATSAEADNYTLSNAREQADLDRRAAAIALVAGGLPEIKAYLAAKFPGDFA